ncbi:hypothetical protein L9F63_011321 [Diploptera punctata]|uniref:Ubiquitin-like protease family profile domain-containing protein n=1 Tax=Diploptera punctata TaxID=6984 RepID=A0AAD8AFU1_DIPPU|nr:hypothetical protein L9F63_011321 [Diploptera punctata]
MSENPVVLSFHETLLHQSDIDLLKGPHWLNDKIISFYFEYLEKIVYRDENNFLFISPEVTQCLKISPARELGIFLIPLNLQKRRFIFLALNDCELVESPGGTHWSLLVYSKSEETFFHFDSSSGSNFKEAWKLTSNLLKYLKVEGDFIETESLQQINCYDCGIHVICNVDLVAEYCTKYGKVKGCGKLDENYVATKRTEILDLIENIKEQ